MVPPWQARCFFSELSIIFGFVLVFVWLREYKTYDSEASQFFFPGFLFGGGQ
jgi:hypothetical protein